ncbi:UBX domain-containing protein 2 [Neolecta irregularis DAH-3]|uniref:UBX domain-containing protein 2 n=1 Tax=Neolecta irregularis (strain DAH-3) TaxID=1198029 RepID=A0A1U7LU28_NEOID|nr:UBX domain-containing protein 2 [Neolecta irregularis DAH-3]|eukprot:OLL26167.1 UBX domain-containing protein 2 [Neolecta irregularis DAH-3]
MTDLNIDQEILGQFCAITDAAPQTAIQYLRVSDNLEQAITLFYESGGADLVGANDAPSRQSAEIVSETHQDLLSGSHIDDDEAMARRLQAEFSESAQENDGQVRAPISPTRDILVDPSMGDIGGMIPQFGAIQGASRSTRRGIFNQAQPSVWDNSEASLAEATGGASREGDKASRLASMYRPPFEIMTDMALEDACPRRRQTQKEMDYDYHTKYERIFLSVVESGYLVRPRHILDNTDVKHNMDTHEGQQILQLYPVRQYPNLLIIDPRTGEKMKEIYDLGEPPTKGHLMMALMDFLDRFSLDPKKKNPVPKTSTSKSIEDMTEDEQMNAAMMESLKPSSPNSNTPNNREMGVLDNEDQSAQSPETTPNNDIFANLTPVHRDETTANLNTTRIQLRFPDGTRVVRKFDLDVSVRHIFEFILSDVDCAKGRVFDVTFMGNNLLEKLEMSLADAGLKSSSLTIEYRT